jgi:hypothetical protein
MQHLDQVNPQQLAVTIISVEEQIKGRFKLMERWCVGRTLRSLNINYRDYFFRGLSQNINGRD